MIPEVDDYLGRIKQWSKELSEVRALLLECGLTEEYKWRVPCYTYNNRNILLLGNFKEYFTISFFKGVLLKDTDGLLTSPGENSQSVKMFKLTSLEELVALSKEIKAYVFEAIEIEKAGLKVEKKQSTGFELVEELQEKLAEMPKLKKAFEALTPGRQRAYNIFFSGAKQSKTKIDRINKYIPRILDGKGINDCVCGHSKKYPSCDGSHKYYD